MTPAFRRWRSRGTRTRTTTKTRTRTETRTSQLARQINLFVATVTGSRSFRDVIARGAEEQWIESVSVRLLGSDERIRHEAVLTIDWQDHIVALGRSDQGLIDEQYFNPQTGWIGNALTQLAEDFTEIAHEGHLTTEWTVSYTAAAVREIDYVRRELGLVTAAKREWAPGYKQTLWGPFRDPALHELSIVWTGVTPPR